MTRLLMRHGADARKGVYPHREATCALTLAIEHEYDDIVAIIREEEARRPIVSKIADVATQPSADHATGFGGGRGANVRLTFVQLVNGFLRQLGTFDNGDIAPTAAMLAAHKSACNDLGKSVAEWRALNGADLSALNAALTAAGKTPLAKAVGVQAPACGP